MSIRKKILYVILLVVMAACSTSMFFSFQPKSAAAWTGTKLITISSDTTWDNIRLNPDTTYEIKKGVTVTLVGTITVRGNITITGGTIRTTPDAKGYFDAGYEYTTFTLNDVTIDGEGNEYSDPIIKNGNSKTIINLNRCTIKDYKIKKNNGSGIIKLYGSALNITNSTITGCTGGVGMITTDAGADSVNKIKITSSNITDNKNRVFSGISMDITIDGGTFENNDGGLIAVRKAYSTSPMVTINGGTFKNNSAKNGGVISSNGSTVTINGGNFTNNSATDKGGVIYNSTAESRVYLYGGYFADNTANGSPNDIYNADNAAIDLNIGSANVPTRTGYTYGGWKDNNGNIYNKANHLYSVSGANNGLTVIWNANSYNINYSGMEGATLSPKPTAHVYGTNTAIANPVKTGYTFNGWKVNGGAAVKNLTLGATDYTNVISLQATWSANKYTVAFDKQNGTGGSTSAAVTFNSAMPAITVPTRTGYTFGGYYTAKNGGGTQYYTSSGASAKNWNIAANTTLYAKWTAKTYTVTFDKQNGTGGSASVTATFNGAMPAITVPTRTGYTFGGYYTAKNGGGTQYYTASGASAKNWNITANTTLYAKWTANTYTITYNANKPGRASASIAGSTAKSTHTYDVAKSLTANGYSLVGWTFRGWATSANGAVLYGDEDTVKNLTSTANGTYNLYAVWEANKYTVTFVTEGGSSVSPAEATFDSGLPTIGLPTRAGYMFGGFYTAKNGGGTRYYTASGASAKNWNIAANTTLYAKWTANTYTITYNANKPSRASASIAGSTAKSTHTYDVAKSLTANGYSLVGWTFRGWATSANGAVLYGDEDTVKNLTSTANGTYNLYAVWEANKYTVTFVTAGGSSVSPVEATFDSGLPTIGLPTRAGYMFDGFYTAKNGGGTQYYKADGTAETDKYKVAGNLTLFAKWIPVSYTIAFYDGDTFIKKTENVVYGAEITLPSAEALGLTRKNYNFVGWNLYSDQTWAMYKADTVYTGGFAEENGKTVILRAAWEEKNVYPIYFDANGGMGAPATAMAHEGETVLLGAGVPVRQNHTFIGWATDASAENAEYLPNAEFTMDNSPVTLYAVWKHNPALTYNANGGSFASAVAVTYPAAGAEVTVADMPPQLEGHEFIGWKIGADGTVTYCAGEKFTMPDTDTVLYAVWQKKTYPVTATVADGYSVVGLNDSYKFGDVALFTVTGGSVKVYADGELLTASETGKYSFIIDGATSVLVVADDGSRFSVVYNANGGSGAPVDANIYQADTSATVSSASPLRLGYTFLGWTKKPTASTAELVGGETVTLADKDLVLYAVWKANTYTVKYNAFGGFGSMSADAFTFDVESVLKKNAFTKEGHTFTGWALSANGNAVYNDCETVFNLCSEDGGEITLYAVWKAIVTNIELVWDETVRDSFAISYGGTFSSTGRVTPVKNGYTFGGYYTGREGGGEQIFDENLNVVYANNWDKNEEKITLYAYWVPNSETLTAQIRELKNANAALTDDIDALKNDNLSMSGSITALSASLETAQNTIDSLGDTYATDGELASAVAALKKKIEEAKNALNAKVNEVQTNLDKAVSDLTKTVGDNKSDIEGKLAAVKEAYEAADAVIDSGIAALQTKDGELEESIANLKTTSEKADSDLKAAIDKVQTNLDKAVSDLTKTIGENKTDIEGKLAAVKEAYEAADAVINSGIAALQTKDGELEESIANLKTTSEKADSDLKAAIDKVQTNLDKAVNNLSKTVGENKTDIEGKLAAVKEAYEAADAVINSGIAALQTKDGELEESIANLKTSSEKADSDLKAAIDKVQTNLDKAVNDLTKTVGDNKSDIEGKLAAVKEACEAADAVINSGIAALQTKDGELEESIANLKTSSEKADSDLKAAIDKVQTNLDKAVNDLTKTVGDNKSDIEGKLAAVKEACEAADAVINSGIAALQTKDGELEESIANLKTSSEKADSDLKAAIDKVQTNLDKAVNDLTKTVGDNKSDIEGKLAAVKEAYEAADAVINGNLKVLNVNLENEVSMLEKAYKEADNALAEAIKKVQANLDEAKRQLENKDNELSNDIKILRDTTKNMMIALIVIGGVLLLIGVSVVVLFVKRKVGGSEKS